jgi:hypothetical protein
LYHRRTRRATPGCARELDLPTLTALRFNPSAPGFVGRLVAAGNPEMRAVGVWGRELAIDL